MSNFAHHHIPLAAQGISLNDSYDAPAWSAIPALEVSHFHAHSSAHRPVVTVRLAATKTHLLCRWRVVDAQVLSKITETNGSVCTDTCVELFFAPLAGHGYFNLEINAGGTKHCSYIEDCSIVDNRFAKSRFITPQDLAAIAVRSTLPQVIEPEIPGPTTWEMSVAIPFDLLSAYVGETVSGTGTWRANLYKCADHSSTPHWGSWSPIGDRLAFHQPAYFGYLHFS